MRLFLAGLCLLYTATSIYMMPGIIWLICFLLLAMITFIILVKTPLPKHSSWLVGLVIAGLVIAVIFESPLSGWALLFLFLFALFQLGNLEQRNEQLQKKVAHLERFVHLLQAERHKNYHSHTLFQLTKNERPDVSAWLVSIEEEMRLAQITFRTDFQAPLSDLPFKNNALLPVMSAILANAKQAAALEKNSWVTWRLKQQSGLFLFEISNATSEPSQKIMDNLFLRPKLESGTALIKREVSRVHGTIDYRFDHHTFKLIIKLPAMKD